ncbi:MAG: branched-chain amino acid aminotransferase [Actinobacteria bacterium]|nr:branched-chain amino acid aminotransferase [Actinomycetota bacterium]
MNGFRVNRSGSPVPEQERARILTDPGFGRYFTDHMASAVWTTDAGWQDCQVKALEPYSLHPAAAVLHYAQEIFEGLKAMRHADGSIWLFRPDLNARRFVRSAARLALPVLPEELFVDSLVQLVRTDADWVPQHDGEKSLYLRPYMFGSEAFLGVRPAVEVSYGVIASPAGSYFASGVKGVTLWVSERFTRAAPGGTGAAKCGGNYAGGLAAQVEAQQHGCEQVLYLSGDRERYLEESGTMNLFLVTSDGELITPGLGTILEGVTRDSVIELADEHDLKPVERPVSLDDLRTGCDNGTITEMFAAGTAAVITPIVGFKGDGYAHTAGDGTPGKVTMAIREHLLDVQFGRVPDTRNWLHPVVP